MSKQSDEYKKRVQEHMKKTGAKYSHPILNEPVADKPEPKAKKKPKVKAKEEVIEANQEPLEDSQEEIKTEVDE